MTTTKETLLIGPGRTTSTKCESLIAQFRMAVKKLLLCWYHKIGRIKEQSLIIGKNLVEN